MDNLNYHGIIGMNNLTCIRGHNLNESVIHLFFECLVFSHVWYALENWMGFFFSFHNEQNQNICKISCLFSVSNCRAFQTVIMELNEVRKKRI